MKIIIIGCGKVGSALAEELTMENHEVAIVDISAQKLQEVGEDLDAVLSCGKKSGKMSYSCPGKKSDLQQGNQSDERESWHFHDHQPGDGNCCRDRTAASLSFGH